VPYAGYHFDETSGTTAADFTGNNHTATVVGGSAWVAGKINNAIHLGDGSNGRVQVPNDIMAGVSDFTIATWVKLDAIANWERLWDFGINTGTFMMLTPQNGNNGKIRFEIKNSTADLIVDGSTPLAVGSWQHVAVTLSGTTLSIYVNGILQGIRTNVTLKPTDLGVTTHNSIGESQFNDPHLVGAIDDFLIYNKALTAAQVQSLAGVTVPPPTPASLFFGYHFDETTGTAVSDYTGTGHDGTVSGPTSWVTGRMFNAISLDNPGTNTDNGQVNMPAGVVSSLTDFSMAVWVKETAAFDWAQLIDFGTSTATYMAVIPRTGDAAHTLRFTIKNNNSAEQIVDGPGPLPVGTWTHLAVTRSGTTISLYVNGVLQGVNTNITIAPQDMGNTTNNALGFSQWGDHHFDGLIDEFTVYTGTLTPAQVAALANAPPLP
jgi:hypothetical protein